MAVRTVMTRSALAALVFALAACGRAGAPERPSAAMATDTETAAQTGEGAPERPFILDGLIR
ncbi:MULTISPECIES: hypothetical protein [unclassified Roseitalea]|uniref:hypothetical protein n=1 Tax=unclassified Roseitalea TaxID=2639107 RepID=UPI00273D7BA3|nr:MULTISPECIES: hypothetical protein [unclassified Roseitalea]